MANINESYSILYGNAYCDVFCKNVVSYGYYQSSTGQRSFYYMDPNNGERVTTFPSSSSATVYVPLDGHNYAVHCYIYAY